MIFSIFADQIHSFQERIQLPAENYLDQLSSDSWFQIMYNVLSVISNILAKFVFVSENNSSS